MTTWLLRFMSAGRLMGGLKLVKRHMVVRIVIRVRWSSFRGWVHPSFTLLTISLIVQFSNSNLRKRALKFVLFGRSLGRIATTHRLDLRIIALNRILPLILLSRQRKTLMLGPLALILLAMSSLKVVRCITRFRLRIVLRCRLITLVAMMSLSLRRLMRIGRARIGKALLARLVIL